ncbi:MAG: hypothetical protein AAF547_10240 [Actinomycetota bacterium]
MTLILAVIAVIAPTAPPAAAAGNGFGATVDVRNLDPVPVRMWGVSGQNPAETQTASLDVLVWDFAQSGNRMFVGGAFLNVQESKNATPIPQPYVAAFDVDTGEWIDSWTPQIDRAVYSLDVLPNGSLLVGGEFETVNGQPRQGVVALDPVTGAIDPSFPVAVERPWSTLRAVVREVSVFGSDIYLVGNFSHVNNGALGTRTRVYKAARVGTDASIDTAWKPQVTGSGVWGVDADPGRNEVHLAGFFSAVNGEAGTGHFHTVDGTTGATVPGKIELPRNYPQSQPEMFDVVYGDDRLFVIGEQHIVQVLDPADHAMLGFHTTGMQGTQFAASGFFAGGAFQVGEHIGDVVIAGCHCTYSERNGWINHFSSFDQERTRHRLVMAYDASTGELVDEFMPDIHSPRDGTFAVGSDSNGCLYIGGDFHVGGVDAGLSRWLGGFAKLCGGEPPVAGELLAPGSTWRYEDSGTDLGTAWRDPAFDDAAWASGPGELGFGDGDEGTVLTAGSPTYYARTSFDFTGPAPSSLDLRLKADDGAIVYLNGVEVLRDNLPDGTVTHGMTAIDWRGGADEDFRPFTVSASALVEGTNVLAVEVHNVWAGNADLSLDVALGVSDAPPPAVDEPLIALGSTWRHTDSSAGAEPAGWPLAVPAAAAEGPAQFGFGEGDEATALVAGQETYYFSHDFTVVDARAIPALELTTLIDDGAVVYLNGTEIHRYNMPDGPIAWNTRPSQWVGNSEEIARAVTVPAAALVDGANTIAVEVHNFWPGNPDLSFDLRLDEAADGGAEAGNL